MRPQVLMLAYAGCTPLEIWGMLTKQLGVQTTPERVGAYIDSLFYELNPPGVVAPHLYAVQAHDHHWKDNQPLLQFGSGNQADVWTLADFFQGTLILGAAGSGKTSGSGRTLAMNFLCSGFGGLVLTTKPEEFYDWAQMASMAGRENDVVCVCPDSLLRLDMLAYESQRPGEEGKLTENLLHFLKNLVSVLSLKRGQSTNMNFWQSTGDQLLRNLLGCFLAANTPVSIDGISQFLVNAPTSVAAAEESCWRNIPVFGPCLAQAERLATTADKQWNVQILREYWLHHFPTLVPETRSCVTIGFAAMIDALRTLSIHRLIANQTTITPEAILNGRIVIVNLPINQFHEAGLLVQTAWKYLFQRAVLRRPDRSMGDGCRPVFLWEDEAHNFLIDYDAEFNRVARDRRIARVMLSQNINNFYDAFGGGDAARVKVDSILGTLNTRILHANGDLASNKWASESIGTYEKQQIETSTTPPQSHGLDPVKGLLDRFFKKPTVTPSTKTVREPMLHPHDFTTLIPGGAPNGFMTEAIISQVGRTHADGRPYGRVHFNQIILRDMTGPITGNEPALKKLRGA